jgi:predicted Fe-Mo cluster-binding NifX family protein
MRIAVVSRSGSAVDDHFGRAEGFLVYELSDGKLSFVARRSAKPLSTGDGGHGFDEERFRNVADVIKDCQRVYAVRTGDRPKEELKKRGIEAIAFEGPIAEIG